MKNERKIKMEKKTVSINKFPKVYNEGIKTLSINDVEMRIKRFLSLSEVQEMVNTVVEVCVDTETGEYIPEVKDFLIRLETVSLYSNVTLPKDVEKQYALLYDTHAFDVILDNIDTTQFKIILGAIDEKIKFNLSTINSTLTSKFNELSNEMKSYMENTSKLFSETNPSDISKLVSNLSSINKIDEDKVVKAVFDAQKQSSVKNSNPALKVISTPIPTTKG